MENGNMHIHLWVLTIECNLIMFGVRTQQYEQAGERRDAFRSLNRKFSSNWKLVLIGFYGNFPKYSLLMEEAGTHTLINSYK